MDKQILAITFRFACSSVLSNGFRSALTIIGVAIGIASVVVTSGVGGGFRTNVDSELAAFGANILRIEPRLAKSDRRKERSTPKTLSASDATAIKTQIPGVSKSIPIDLSSQFVRRSDVGSEMQVIGSQADLLSVLRARIEEGRVFSSSEETRGAKVALVGSRLAKYLSPGNAADLVGKDIIVKNVPFQVVGLIAPKGPIAGLDLDGLVVLPIKSLRERVSGYDKSNPDFVESIIVEIAHREHKAEINSELTLLLRERHRIALNDDADFSVSDLAAAEKAQTSIMKMIRIFLIFVASVCLSLGGIGIMNMMLVSVFERTREIGVRLAIGARRFEIVTQFLFEAVLLTAAGGSIGVLVGWPIGSIIGEFSGQPFLMTVGVVGAAFIFSIAVGVCFGLYPAIRAARLSPIEALRHD